MEVKKADWNRGEKREENGAQEQNEGREGVLWKQQGSENDKKKRDGEQTEVSAMMQRIKNSRKRRQLDQS